MIILKGICLAFLSLVLWGKLRGRYEGLVSTWYCGSFGHDWITGHWWYPWGIADWWELADPYCKACLKKKSECAE